MGYLGTQNWAQARKDTGDGYSAFWSTSTKDMYYIAKNASGVITYFIGTDGNLDTNFTNRLTLTYVEWNVAAHA
jgi:hypothetical protein